MSTGVFQQKGRSRPRARSNPWGKSPFSAAHGFGALGASADPGCWDQISPCDPVGADQIHMQIRQLQQAIASARAAAAQGDPNAAGAASAMQGNLANLQAECSRRASACQAQLDLVRQKLAQYGCDATTGPFAQGLQQMINEHAGKQIVPENGVFDAACCAAFWQQFGRSPTVADVQASLDPAIVTLFATQKHCGAPNAFSVKLPSCPKPAGMPTKPPGGAPGPQPIPSVTPVYTPPATQKMSAATVGGLIAAVAVIGYAVAKKKGLIG